MSLGDMVVGTFTDGGTEFHIQSLQIRDGFISVYRVTRLCSQNEPYKAQAFAKNLAHERRGLCDALRGRMDASFAPKILRVKSSTADDTGSSRACSAMNEDART